MVCILEPIDISVNPVHAQKAWLSSVVNESGSFVSVILGQKANPLSFITVMPSGSSVNAKLEQFPKQLLSIVFNWDGKEVSGRFVHPLNAEDFISVILSGRELRDKLVHRLNALTPILETPAGIDGISRFGHL